VRSSTYEAIFIPAIARSSHDGRDGDDHQPRCRVAPLKALPSAMSSGPGRARSGRNRVTATHRARSRVAVPIPERVAHAAATVLERASAAQFFAYPIALLRRQVTPLLAQFHAALARQALKTLVILAHAGTLIGG
jgi:hypothetical protein